MRTLEIRRHTHRHIPQTHLSQIGVELARRAGEGLGKFDRVVTSTIPRAFETAIAMGYAVDEQIEQFGLMNDKVDTAIQWNAGFTAWAKTVQNNSVVAHYAQSLADALHSIVRALPEEGRALIISHGGIVEACVIGCVPATTRFTDDAACGYCEGARLTFSEEVATHLEILRIEQPR